MSAVSSTFRANFGMHSERSAISLSLQMCRSNQGSLAISIQVWNSVRPMHLFDRNLDHDSSSARLVWLSDAACVSVGLPASVAACSCADRGALCPIVLTSLCLTAVHSLPNEPEFYSDHINCDARRIRRPPRCRQTSRLELSPWYSPRRNSWFEKHFALAPADRSFRLE